MSADQLKASIELGSEILEGARDLVELDSGSLELRGKGGNSGSKARGYLSTARALKRKRESDDGEPEGQTQPETLSAHAYDSASLHSPSNPVAVSKSRLVSDDLTPFLKKIALSEKTSFQKNVLTVLCQVPRGQYTTYAAISTHLSSSPRAVGNALRNNPFAPQVPCHRVLASSGGIGGFEGSWGRNGKEGLNDGKKRKLLRDEGVKFDGKGRVVGIPWAVFK